MTERPRFQNLLNIYSAEFGENTGAIIDPLSFPRNHQTGDSDDVENTKAMCVWCGTFGADLCILVCHYRWPVNPIKLLGRARVGRSGRRWRNRRCLLPLSSSDDEVWEIKMFDTESRWLRGFFYTSEMQHIRTLGKAICIKRKESEFERGWKESKYIRLRACNFSA